MEPPQRSGPSRLLYRRGVEDPHLESSVRGDGDAVFLKQFHAQRIEPVPRFPEPLQQRHVRQIRQARLPSPHHGLSQRMSASQMDQQRPQQLLRRLVLAQPSQRPRLRRQILPVVRKERDQQVPVLACRPLHHGSAHASTIQNYDAEDKLALMPPPPPPPPRQRGCAPRCIPINHDQKVLQPLDIENLIPAEHPARKIWAVAGMFMMRREEGEDEKMTAAPSVPSRLDSLKTLQDTRPHRAKPTGEKAFPVEVVAGQGFTAPGRDIGNIRLKPVAPRGSSCTRSCPWTLLWQGRPALESRRGRLSIVRRPWCD